MNSKGIIAIIVVVILVVAGVGVGVFFANQNNNNNSGVDKIKDKIEVGDIIATNGYWTNINSYEDWSLGEFVLGAYTECSVPTGKTKQITFKDKTYDCAGYEGVDSLGNEIVDWVTDGKFVLERDVPTLEGEKIILADTSMDVTLDKETQLTKIKEDAFYDYDLIDDKGELLMCTSTILSYYAEDDPEILVAEIEIVYEDISTKKVTNVDGENVQFEDGSTMTKAEINSMLLRDSFVDYFKSEGWTVQSRGITQSAVENTPFGDREVVKETFKLSFPGSEESLLFKLTYGKNGVIYGVSLIENVGQEDLEILVYTTEYEKNTTLIVPA